MSFTAIANRTRDSSYPGHGVLTVTNRVNFKARLKLQKNDLREEIILSNETNIKEIFDPVDEITFQVKMRQRSLNIGEVYDTSSKKKHSLHDYKLI